MFLNTCESGWDPEEAQRRHHEQPDESEDEVRQTLPRTAHLKASTEQPSNQWRPKQ